MRTAIRLAALALLLGGRVAMAFPEMVRHGYVHCTACHVQVTGGGLLNAYGRTLSRELLSQETLGGKPSAEGDESFAAGTITPPDWLQTGGDVRVLQTFLESKTVSSSRFFIMQVDLDFSADLSERVRAFFSVGRVEPRVESPTAKDFVSSPRHGIEFLLSPPEAESRWSMRAGRFMPAFGIQFAEHPLVTRGRLDFMPGQERTAADLTWSDDRTMATVTGIFAQSSGNQLKKENGGAFHFGRAVGESSKIGFSLYQTQRDDNNVQYQRDIQGVWGLFGWTKEWYGLLEIDRMKGAEDTWGAVETFKVGKEIRRGLHLIGIHEYANVDLAQANPKTEAYSFGTEWYPRPHWELFGLVRKQRNTSNGNDAFEDAAWLIAHFYL